MTAHPFSPVDYLCDLGEIPPVPGERFMDWGCSGCRAAWIAAVMNGVDPVDVAGHYERGRSVADRLGDPHFSRAVAMLGLRAEVDA